MPLVSIIVPVYNREKSIAFCLQSISEMNCQDFEVLVIDDGSTDNSGVICDNFCAMHEKFRCIHQPNGGVSNARNHGIREAKGDWITFIDSDDAVCKEHLDGLVNEAGSCVDLVIADFYMVGRIKDDFVIPACSQALAERIVSDEPVKYMFSDFNPYEKPLFSTWGKFFKLTTCIQHGVRFNESLSLDEDQLFVSTYFKYVKRLVHYPQAKTYLFLDWGGEHLSGKMHPMEVLLNVYKTNYTAFKELYSKGGEPCVCFSTNYIIERLIGFILLRYARPSFYKKLEPHAMITFVAKDIYPIIQSIKAEDVYIRNKNISLIYKLIRSKHYSLAVTYCRLTAMVKSLKNKLKR